MEFTGVIFCKAARTGFINPECLLLRERRRGSCKPPVAISSSSGQNITVFYVCLQTPCVLALDSQPTAP